MAALAAEATGAEACLLWRYGDSGSALAALGGPRSSAAPAGALDILGRAQASREPLVLEPSGDRQVVTLQLGEPPLGALQLVFAEAPDPSVLPDLATFAVRAAHALRATERRRELAEELERTRALLTIVGQAISELSLSHTLDTAVDGVRELLGTDRAAVYLLEEGERLEAAAERGLTGPHVRIGERLLELALGPGRARGLIHVSDGDDPRLAPVRDALEELGVEGALGVPLRAGDELVGLLAVYPQRGRQLSENEEALVRALAAQLAVAVQNARLHERLAQESEDAKRARDEALEASRRLRALYEISAVVQREPFARGDPGGGREDDRRLPRARRGCAAHAERARRCARAGRDPRARGAAERARAPDPVAGAAARLGEPEPLPQRRACRALRRQRAGARPRAPGAGPVPGEGLDRGADPARGARRDARHADPALARRGAPGHRRHARSGARARGPGRARARQRAVAPGAARRSPRRCASR